MPVRTISELPVEKRPGGDRSRWWRIVVAAAVSAAFLWIFPSYSVLWITNTSSSPAFVIAEIGKVREPVAVEPQRGHFAAGQQSKEGALGVIGVPGCESVYVPKRFTALVTCHLAPGRGRRSSMMLPSIACAIAILVSVFAFWRLWHRVLWRPRA